MSQTAGISMPPRSKSVRIKSRARFPLPAIPIRMDFFAVAWALSGNMPARVAPANTAVLFSKKTLRSMVFLLFYFCS